MIRFAGRVILLDIEGTTSSISFVHDVMFPYARRHLRDYLEAHFDEADARGVCNQIAIDAGHDSLDAWAGDADRAAVIALVAAEVERLMDGDVKATGLKALQGLIWKAGFESGEMVAHVYDDVPPALRRWRDAGLELRIYSSGSIAAQKLFFGHTEAGDLLGHFAGHYDTTIGGKKDAASYRAILADIDRDPSDVLFVSDVPAELDAARDAGLATALSIRPGNGAVDDTVDHPPITTFDDIRV